jgi:hypothetical protein
MCGVSRRHFFFLLLARRSEPEQVLCALELLMLSVKLRQKREVLRFCFRQFATEDDGQRLTASHMVAKHDWDLPYDTVRNWRHLYLAIFVGFYYPGDTKSHFRCAFHHRGRVNLSLVKIIGCEINLGIRRGSVWSIGRSIRLSFGSTWTYCWGTGDRLRAGTMFDEHKPGQRQYRHYRSGADEADDYETAPLTPQRR